MDLDQPLPSFIVIRGHKLFLEYEGLHSVCFSCGRYGYKVDKCSEAIVSKNVSVKDHPMNEAEVDPDKVVEVKESNVTQNVVVDTDPSSDNIKDSSSDEVKEYGSWMVVKMNQRRKPQKKQSNDGKMPVKVSKQVVKESRNLTIEKSKNVIKDVTNPSIEESNSGKTPSDQGDAGPSVQASPSIQAIEHVKSSVGVRSLVSTFLKMANPQSAELRI